MKSENRVTFLGILLRSDVGNVRKYKSVIHCSFDTVSIKTIFC
jgi:hypothetical protein